MVRIDNSGRGNPDQEIWRHRHQSRSSPRFQFAGLDDAEPDRRATEGKRKSYFISNRGRYAQDGNGGRGLFRTDLYARLHSVRRCSGLNGDYFRHVVIGAGIIAGAGKNGAGHMTVSRSIGRVSKRLDADSGGKFYKFEDDSQTLNIRLNIGMTAFGK